MLKQETLIQVTLEYDERQLSLFLGEIQMTGNQISNHLIAKGKDFGNMTNTIIEDKTKRNALCGMKTE